MSTTQTANKTLEATLAPPTRCKEQRLQQTLSEYRDALEDAFEQDCTTMSATNDVVTPYNLPYQAKDALKSYVPKLHKTYNAKELDDEHPLRFVNRAGEFDRDSSREYEICWNVPQPGRGTNFWIPLRLNPDHQELWNEMLDDESSTKVGELRLQKHRKTWTLHVTVEYEIEDTSEIPENPTRVGFDIGESMLVAGCALQHDTPTKPLLINGKEAKRIRKEMFTTLKRLQERDASEWRVEERFSYYQNRLTDIIEKASRESVEYARQFENPVIVMEDLAYIRESLDYGKYMNRRLHSWAFARLQGRIEDKAKDAGIPVQYVHPQYTSKTCHSCKHIGYRPRQAEFTCKNPECHVSTFQADINASANIARRVDPWGESLPWKQAGDDSPRDGSRCDAATTQCEQSETPSQMTLTPFQESKPTAGND
ncbi:transposase [Halobellus sp. Atlit-38R]|uniref:RNA-guided endonuclease TnpB family protein n=1 Tax=Halobellus sp. Atlit-38R TaxID=2282131 RepID=UPI000EF1B22B|nr:RNA-guided endonuclease TnpB family protein [Halobellus sp. Atlit-38R]RLM83738.1 transposase [Halobellus sp. Atlit-38R]